MNKKLKNAIIFVCLNENFGRSVSKNLAETLSLHFVDIEELIEYDLFNSGDVINQLGQDYYLMREKRVVLMACSYESAVMFCGFDIYSHNKDVFDKKATKVYLQLDKKLLSKDDVINILGYEERDLALRKECDFTVELKKVNEKLALKEICKKLGEIK